ncbi:cytosol aminopeptidase isoform X2 [Tetranychus urticae]|uniref:cytosol aminopeptidase isoform X2 n=1 Tax=Tetranychus urticae TaxID=32264 RepID=UPI00077C0AB6|nr:cytosol aminopeptidase isoform X2 [Tetranychus urticae]
MRQSMAIAIPFQLLFKSLLVASVINPSSTRLRSTLTSNMKALIVGAYEGSSSSDSPKLVLTKNGQSLDFSKDILKSIETLGPVKKGKSRIFQGISNQYLVVSLVNLGPGDAGINPVEQLDEKKENTRLAVAEGLKSIRGLDSEAINEVVVDDCGDAQSAAEGIFLSDWKFDELKDEKSRRKPLSFSLLNPNGETAAAWERGRLLARGQIIARRLADMPANLMTPTIFAEEVVKATEGTSVKVNVRDKAWIESMKMGSFLSVAQGSSQPPKFVELHYNNAPDTKPLVFVGKGITFDSGGISIKPSADMDQMRADMTGAAIVAGTIITLAALKAKVNVIGLTPLSENLVNGEATKPGDVHRAMNGKTIQIDNTDAEGRLVLADALTYADTFNPQAVVDIATLTGAMKITFGTACSGVWSTNDKLWNLIHKTSIDSGDRVWRMPLFKHYTKEISDCHLADLNNMGKSRQGGSNIAAAFLQEFISCPNWMHIDIAGVMWNGADKGYLTAGMTARPLRTIVPFFESIFQNKL